MQLNKNNLLNTVKVELSKWFLNNFGESLEAILNDNTRLRASAPKRSIAAQALYMLGFDHECIAEIMGRSSAETRSFVQLKDPFTTATALDLHAYMAKFMELYFTERLLELQVDNSKYNAILEMIANDRVHCAELDVYLSKHKTTNYDVYRNNVYNYYVKRMREKHGLYKPKTMGELRDEA